MQSTVRLPELGHCPLYCVASPPFPSWQVGIVDRWDLHSGRFEHRCPSVRPTCMLRRMT